MTPTRLRQIAQQLVNNCSAYQEKIMQSGKYLPCQTCAEMAEELRKYAKTMEPHLVTAK
jgi:hypothetical protein